MELHDIFKQCGVHVVRKETLHGGDINQCYLIDTRDSRYFLKVNDAILYPRMFEKEAAGLKALSIGSSLKVPAVLKYGTTGQTQFLFLEWIESANPGRNDWENFGRAVAEMHRGRNDYAGWEEDNYIGSLVQSNRPDDRWAIFYSESRILPLLKKLYDAGSFTRKEMIAAEESCKRMALVFPDEPMALLHGDLWSGNKMFTAGGNAAIFDPAVYFGHREMEIGMTKLFGGFDQRFFDAYEETYPLEKDWQRRLPVTQLYPVLVHALLFGGTYIQSALNILQHF